MMGHRWWDVFFGATVIVIAVIGVATDASTVAARWLLLLVLGVLVLAYLVLGRRALRDGRLGPLFAALLIVGSGVAVACNPNTAVIQAIAFPVLWSIFERARYAVIANVILAIAVSAGFLVSLGTGPDVIVQTAMIESISLVGSLALGTWISRIADLSQERLRLLDELTAAQVELAALNRDSGVTSERERLAREIHDTIAQSLTGVVMLSQRAQRELAAGNLGPLDEQLHLLEESARDALVETRSLVAASAPVELGAGLVAALERLAERFGRETGIRVSVDAATLTDLDRGTEVVLLRCAQEALANVRKHSRATSVTISARRNEGSIELVMRDDGSGFDAEEESSGFGLPGMRDRLALVNGSLRIESSPGTGTALHVELPAAVTA